MNLNNFGVAVGRLTRDPAIFDNSDGSKKVKMTIAAQNDYLGKDGKRGVEFINLDGFIPAGKADNGVYGLIHEGDAVGVHYRVASNNYTDKDGKPVFDQSLQIVKVDLKESKAVTSARAAKKAAGEAADETPVEQL